jgi:hypothetical protein
VPGNECPHEPDLAQFGFAGPDLATGRGFEGVRRLGVGQGIPLGHSCGTSDSSAQRFGYLVIGMACLRSPFSQGSKSQVSANQLPAPSCTGGLTRIQTAIALGTAPPSSGGITPLRMAL